MNIIKINLLSGLVFLSVFILGCKNKDEKDNVSFSDYKNDLSIIKKNIESTNCIQIKGLLQNIKTIDGKEKVYNLFGKMCDLQKPITKNSVEDKNLIDKLSQIMSTDQSIRDEYDYIIKEKGLSSMNEKNFDSIIKFRQFYWDSIVKPKDSINLIKIRKIIDSLGEWPGAKYIKREPGNPKLEILVGHMPEKYFKKYTLMALNSAKSGEEYWSRVNSMFTFSFKYILLDKELIHEQRPVIPFLFSEFHSNDSLNIKSELTMIEFDKIGSKKTYNNSSPNILLSSSVKNRDKRLTILNQAKELLANFGYNKSNIEINKNYFPYDKYKLYYEIVD